MNRTTRTGLVAAIILSASASVAMAVPAATYSISGGTGLDLLTNYSQSGTFSTPIQTLSQASGGGSPGGSANASSQVTNGADPILTVTTATSYTPNINSYDAVALATVTYYVEATGGSANVFSAKLDFNGTYSQNLAFSGAEDAGPVTIGIGSQGQTAATSLFALTGPSDTSYLVYAQSQFGTVTFQSNPIAINGSISFSTTTWIQKNQVYPITMSVEATSQNANSPNSCTLDPLATLDAAFLASDPGVTLLVSDGFGVAAPEPSVLALLSLAAIPAFALRRRQNRA